jgi:alkanesulfonate monooxygenase
MPIEFLGMGATNDGSETNRRSNGSFDPEFTIQLARAHEENGWDRVLTAYGSGSPDPAQAAALIAMNTERLQVLVAHRPNLSIPTFAAKTFATIDRMSNGRLLVHFITGGSDHEQQREGDFLGHDERYSRTHEYIEIVKKVWTMHEAFDHEGEHYRFADFRSDVFPVQEPHPPISFGGSSDAAYAVGAAVADIYCLWGEPLADTAEQIARVEKETAAAGRPRPKIQVAFRPILGPTEEKAWERAYAIVEQISSRRGGKNPWIRKTGGSPENTGSKRLLEIVVRGVRFDRALFTTTARVTGAAGNSNALVGTPETVAAAMLDYVDLGIDILSARGYDSLQDTIDFGQQVIPIIREEVAKRDRLREAARA